MNHEARNRKSDWNEYEVFRSFWTWRVNFRHDRSQIFANLNACSSVGSMWCRKLLSFNCYSVGKASRQWVDSIVKQQLNLNDPIFSLSASKSVDQHESQAVLKLLNWDSNILSFSIASVNFKSSKIIVCKFLALKISQLDVKSRKCSSERNNNNLLENVSQTTSWEWSKLP